MRAQDTAKATSDVERNEHVTWNQREKTEELCGITSHYEQKDTRRLR